VGNAITCQVVTNILQPILSFLRAGCDGFS
jgi:hypothetical protein